MHLCPVRDPCEAVTESGEPGFVPLDVSRTTVSLILLCPGYLWGASPGDLPFVGPSILSKTADFVSEIKHKPITCPPLTHKGSKVT